MIVNRRIYSLGLPLLAALFFSLFSHCQSTNIVKLENSLLWTIEGPGLEHPTYLYGTIHLISQSDFFLSDPVTSAFNESEQIVLELDMDDPQLSVQMMQKAAMSDGQTLDKLLEPDIYQQLDSLVKKNAGMGIALFNNWQPMLTFSLITQEFIDGPVASYELTFVQMAQKGQKEVLGLESVAEQIDAIGNISYEEQAAYLEDQIVDMESNRSLFHTMVDLYKKQNITDLEKYIVESEGGDAFAIHLLKNRNTKWIDRMVEMAAQKPSFFAVGAGHLAGTYGLINLMRKAGYTVSPVID